MMDFTLPAGNRVNIKEYEKKKKHTKIFLEN